MKGIGTEQCLSTAGEHDDPEISSINNHSAFLSLIPSGLNDAEQPDVGGWDGRYELYKPDFFKMKEGGSSVEIALETQPIWINAVDAYTSFERKAYGPTFKPGKKIYTGQRESLWCWCDHFQHDLAARMDWTV